jgi:hypothetical protein
VIVCQERVIDKDGTEVVYWGAFLKDDADIEPLALEESGPNTFFWQIRQEVPDHLQASLDALRKAETIFANKADAVRAIIGATAISDATAYRHIKDLVRRHLIEELAGGGIAIRTATASNVSQAKEDKKAA